MAIIPRARVLMMQHLSSKSSFRSRALAWWLLLALSVPACSRPEEVESSAAPSEATFAEQAAEVREGKSNQIRLARTPASDDDLKELADLDGKLKRLNLSHTNISDTGLARIAEIGSLTQLRLASEQISDAGLVALDKLTDLEHLHLIGAPLTDAGLDHLHSLKGLKSLYLDGTQATDEGIARLTAALPHSHLHLDGGHHRLDPQPADHKH